jgi:isoleucyl-tRNA synthetase
VSAHYIVRRRDRFWLLERKDTNCELALFDTQHKAIKRGQTLAALTLPSQLEICHDTRREHKHYSFVTTPMVEPLASELYEQQS